MSLSILVFIFEGATLLPVKKAPAKPVKPAKTPKAKLSATAKSSRTYRLAWGFFFFKASILIIIYTLLLLLEHISYIVIHLIEGALTCFFS